MTDKKKMIAVCDYETGAVYYYIWARSIAEVAAKYPGFTEFLTKLPHDFPEHLLKGVPEIDIDDDPPADKGFLHLMSLTQEDRDRTRADWLAQIPSYQKF